MIIAISGLRASLRRLLSLLLLSAPLLNAQGDPRTSPMAFTMVWPGDTSLAALLRDGLRTNADLQGAAARVGEARAIRRAALGGFLPGVSGNVSAGANQIAFGPNVVAFDAIRATADLSWELDLFGRVRSNVRAARWDLAAQQADQAAIGLTVTGEILNVYVQLRATDASVEMLVRARESRERSLQLARTRFDAGLTSEADVLQFIGQVGDARVRLADSERQQAVLDHQLLALTGSNRESVARGLTISELLAQAPAIDTASFGDISRRPDVIRAEGSRRAAHARASVGNSDPLPRLTVTGQYGSQVAAASQLFGRSGEIYTLQAGLAIPLFFGGQRVASLAAARARALQADAQGAMVERLARQQVRDATAALRSASASLQASVQQADAWQRAEALVLQRYEAGLTSAFEVLDAQRTALNANLTRLSAQQALLLALITWQRVTATLPTSVGNVASAPSRTSGESRE